jgi:hypothetical protein
MQPVEPLLTVYRLLEPPVPYCPLSKAANMNVLPSAMFGTQRRSEFELAAVIMKGWPCGMTPRIRTGATAYADQEMSMGSHCF